MTAAAACRKGSHTIARRAAGSCKWAPEATKTKYVNNGDNGNGVKPPPPPFHITVVKALLLRACMEMLMDINHRAQTGKSPPLIKQIPRQPALHSWAHHLLCAQVYQVVNGQDCDRALPAHPVLLLSILLLHTAAPSMLLSHGCLTGVACPAVKTHRACCRHSSGNLECSTDKAVYCKDGPAVCAPLKQGK